MENPIYLWLIAGAVMLCLEAFAIPGIGFLFAGIAALCTGVTVKAGIVTPENIIAQFAWFFGLTTLWAAILWKPMQKFRTNSKGGQTYNNIIGHHAIVSKAGLVKGALGEVTWSGTLMNAELASDSPAQEAPGGSKVTIVGVKGSTLIVTTL